MEDLVRKTAKRLTTTLAGAGFLTLAACTQAPPAPADTREQEAAAIRKADTDAATAATARNVDALMAFYTDDTTVMPPNAAMITGRENAKKFFADMMNLPDFSIAWQPTKAEAARSGDVGYSIGTYHNMFTAPDGGMVMEDGKYATVWKKQADGSWKLAVDMFNSNMPLPAPPAKGKSKS
jgi:ketosteroid isomerase-like protein